MKGSERKIVNVQIFEKAKNIGPYVEDLEQPIYPKIGTLGEKVRGNTSPTELRSFRKPCRHKFGTFLSM